MKWNKQGIAGYNLVREKMEQNGWTALKCVDDKANNDNPTSLTWWCRDGLTCISQVWTQTGDVAYWLPGSPDQAAGGA